MRKDHKKRVVPLFKVFMSTGLVNPLKQVLYSGYIGQGTKVIDFEEKLAQFINNPLVLTVNSGTSALHLALRLADVEWGDEVISTAMTCTATNWPILAQGAKIRWADIDPATGNVDPDTIKKLITKKTKAIMVVDWGGYPCDIDTIKNIAGDIPVIEDAAHAFGSIYKKRMVGQSADFTCFSFQAIKHLTTADGGALFVKERGDYERGKLLRWYGIDREKRSQEDRIEIDVNEWGYKFHMNDVNATIGIENLKYVNDILQKHRRNADYFRRKLEGLEFITLLRESKNYVSSYWLFTIKVKNRPKFSKYMASKKIMVSQVHRRNDTHPVVVQFRTHLPGLDEFTKSMVCIPVGWWLTKKECERIVDAITNYNP